MARWPAPDWPRGWVVRSHSSLVSVGAHAGRPQGQSHAALWTGPLGAAPAVAGSRGEGSGAAASYLSSSDGQEGAHARQHFAAVQVGHVTFLRQKQKTTGILITERTQIGHDTLFQAGQIPVFVLNVPKKNQQDFAASSTGCGGAWLRKRARSQLVLGHCLSPCPW